jgi:phage baseplate assembly protein W
MQSDRVIFGWALPLRLGPDGSPPGFRPDPVIDTVRLILEIAPGERRLEPEFGCRMHDLPRLDSHALRQVAAALAEEALERWAPWLGAERVEVTGVEGADVDLVVRARGSSHRLRVRHRSPEAAPRAPDVGARGSRRPVPVEERAR